MHEVTERNCLVQVGIVLSTGVALKLLHAISTADDLGLILVPVNFLVEIFLQETGQYIPGQGFYYQHESILIDKSCAGVNFLIIAWCTLGTFYFYRSKDPLKTILHLAVVGVSVYLMTIAANASRIVSAIQLLSLTDSLPFIKTKWFHEGLGACVYLITLIAAIFLINLLKQKKLMYANLS